MTKCPYEAVGENFFRPGLNWDTGADCPTVRSCVQVKHRPNIKRILSALYGHLVSRASIGNTIEQRSGCQGGGKRRLPGSDEALLTGCPYKADPDGKSIFLPVPNLDAGVDHPRKSSRVDTRELYMCSVVSMPIFPTNP